MQNNFTNFKLNTESPKYRLVIITTLFLICVVSVFSMTINPEMMIITNSDNIGNETQSRTEQNLILKTTDTTSTSSALKVETGTIPGPVSFNSGDNRISDSDLQIKIYLKKQYSLISHSNLIISKTVHYSPLITKLQI